MSTYKRYTIFALIAVFIASSCASRKRKEDVGGFKKFYHNVTSKYNGYFNANEIMEETYASIEENHRDNYTNILPVYPETQMDPESYKANMDKVIEKVTTVATIHEVSDYVDDCYVMMGKAQFLKQDYETAEETFEFIQEEFDPNDPSSRNYKKKVRTADDRKKKKIEERQVERKKQEEERKAKAKAKEEEQRKRDEAREQKEKEQKEAREKREREQKQENKRKEREREIEKKKREQEVEDRKSMSKEDRKKVRDNRLEAQRQAARTEKNKEEQEGENASNIAEVIEETKDTLVTVSAEASKVEEEIQKTIEPVQPEIVEEKEKIAEDNAEDYTPRKRDDDVKEEKSSYHEGVLMLALTYIERERYTSADFLLRQLWNNPTVKESVKKEIPAARAHSAILQKEYDEAKPYLIAASEIADGKNNRARYAYILAQLEEQSKNYSSARDYYEKAKKLGSEYELELNAELNMIKNDLLSRSMTPRKGEEKLLDMRKDRKNIEYRDRISYILAEIAIAEPNIEKATTYLKEALKNKSDNTNLQAEAYYLLGSIYYDSDEFVSAKYYYDSTLTVMSKKDSRLKEVEKLAKNLSAIAENIETIEVQDSLLRIGSLSESDQIEYAKNVIESQKVNAEAKDQPKPQSISSKIQRVNISRRASTLKSDFFAYDQGSLNKGKKEFKDKWGERTLQPNWRRSEALRISARPTESAVEIIEEEDNEDAEEAAIQEILDRLPTNPESIASANNKIENAYFKLGKLYRDNLENYEKSIEAYETLLKRFPESSMKLDVYYYLYLSYLDLPDAVSAERYKNDLISNYPDSEYGKLLSDPSYAKLKLAEQKSLTNYYNEMYNRFSAGDYNSVDNMMSEAESKFGDSHRLRPKFALLSAMTKGKLEGEEAYIKGLQELVSKFPGTAERTRAREILRFLRGDESAFDAVDINAVDDLFEIEEDKLHYIAIIVFNATPEIFDETQLSISKYNKKYHKLKRLQLADITLNRSENIEIILVRKFSDKKKAMEYYNDVVKRPRTYVTNNEVSYDVYPVTQRNYRKILEEKGINKYRGWFEKNYLNPEEADKK